MTFQYKGSARFPGPLGTSPSILGGRLPGPLGFKQVDLAQGGATKVHKTLPMPPPPNIINSVIRARTVSWKLGTKKPATNDVQQGALANCPVGAILAAMAHTVTGQKRIDNLITEYVNASVETTLSANVMTVLSSKEQEGGNPDYTPQVKTLLSNRYFAVTLGNTIEVSDAFYVMGSNDTSADMVYMDSPTEMLWPCVIEKAYAVKLKSYEELDDPKHTVEEFWEVLVGKKPVVIRDGSMTEQKIRAAAIAASRVPTIGATKDEVPTIDDAGATRVDSDHGYAVLGIQGSTIELYNPWGRIEKILIKDFSSNFEAIYHGSP